MLVECGRQLLGRGGLAHLGQPLFQVQFGPIDVFERLYEKGVEVRFGIARVAAFLGSRGGRFGSAGRFGLRGGRLAGTGFGRAHRFRLAAGGAGFYLFLVVVVRFHRCGFLVY